MFGLQYTRNPRVDGHVSAHGMPDQTRAISVACDLPPTQTLHATPVLFGILGKEDPGLFFAASARRNAPAAVSVGLSSVGLLRPGPALPRLSCSTNFGRAGASPACLPNCLGATALERAVDGPRWLSA
jgi:hypothetical protein